MSVDALSALPDQLAAELLATDTMHQLDNVRSAYLGPKSTVRTSLIQLGQLPKEERANAGKSINSVKSQLEAAIHVHKLLLIKREEEKKLAQESVDTSLDLPFSRVGALHPLTKTRIKLQRILEKLGFSLVDGVEVESAYYNFTALNTPENHPATTVQDTFYLQDDHLLRSHTSCVQIRTMEDHKPPLRIFSPGRVFRADTPDATHSPCFMQCEGLVVDRTASVVDLEMTLHHILQAFFGEAMKMRFRPSYFPFTEPSFECDIWYQGRWLEILGCGMVHPAVLDNVGIDTDIFRGFAFGLGIDRLTMLYYNLDDIRLLYESDVRFLEQFRED